MTMKLKAQEQALCPHKSLRLMREVCDGSGLVVERVKNIDIMNHRPGKRLTIRYTIDDGSRHMRFVYAKLYRKHKGERIRDALTWLTPRVIGPISLPKVLGYCPRRRILILDGLSGVSMQELLPSSQAQRILANFGRALAQFHDTTVPADALPRHDGAAEDDVLHLAQRRMAGSSLSRSIRNHFTEIASYLRHDLKNPLHTEPALLHRDLYPQQVIVQPEGFGLVDLDELSSGERELDVGNFIAHFILADFQERGAITKAYRDARSLLLAYRDHVPLGGRRLRLYTAASLLRLASLERISEPARSNLAWPQLARALIQEAELVYSDKGQHQPSAMI